MLREIEREKKKEKNIFFPSITDVYIIYYIYNVQQCNRDLNLIYSRQKLRAWRWHNHHWPYNHREDKRRKKRNTRRMDPVDSVHSISSRYLFLFSPTPNRSFYLPPHLSTNLSADKKNSYSLYFNVRGDNIKIRQKKRDDLAAFWDLFQPQDKGKSRLQKDWGSAELLFLFLMNSEIWNMEILFRLLQSRIRVTAVRPLAVCRGQRGAIGLGYLNNMA